MRCVVAGDVAYTVASGSRTLDQILAVFASSPSGERHVTCSASRSNNILVDVFLNRLYLSLFFFTFILLEIQ